MNSVESPPRIIVEEIHRPRSFASPIYMNWISLPEHFFKLSAQNVHSKQLVGFMSIKAKHFFKKGSSYHDDPITMTPPSLRDGVQMKAKQPNYLAEGFFPM
eukprot:1158323-Pelagomonas_calceolata.AAC.2